MRSPSFASICNAGQEYQQASQKEAAVIQIALFPCTACTSKASWHFGHLPGAALSESPVPAVALQTLLTCTNTSTATGSIILMQASLTAHICSSVTGSAHQNGQLPRGWDVLDLAVCFYG